MLAVGSVAAQVAEPGQDVEDATLDQLPIVPTSEFLPRLRDSGLRPNPADDFKVVYADVVRTEGVAWQRLHFSELELEGESYIRMTSLQDGDVQELNRHMAMVWSNSTAYFNGDAVMVELVAAPDTRDNRAMLQQVEINLQQIGAASSLCGICFGSDDRVPSDEEFAGRLMNPLCSAGVYNTDSCIVTAGHCIGGSNQVIQFNVPNSNFLCNPVNPPSADQFPLQQVSQSGPPYNTGQDWAAATTGTNHLGQSIYDRYGEFRPLATNVPGSGTVQIWGYGATDSCSLNHTQQLSEGSIVSLDSTTINHRADTTSGNSGSSILQNDEIVGVATHCGEPCPGGWNTGTRIDHNGFQAAIADLCPAITLPTNGCCSDSLLIPSGEITVSNIAAETCGASESLCPGGHVESDIWYVRQVQCTGEWSLTVTDSDFPVVVAVYAGQQCPSSPDEAVACASSNGQPQVILDVEQFDVYRIRIGGENGAQGQATLELHCEPTPEPECPADLTGPNNEPDGVVDVFDLLKVIGEWGTCNDPNDCPADLTGPNDEPDGVVDVFDLLKVIGEWGDCD